MANNVEHPLQDEERAKQFLPLSVPLDLPDALARREMAIEAEENRNTRRTEHRNQYHEYP